MKRLLGHPAPRAAAVLLVVVVVVTAGVAMKSGPDEKNGTVPTVLSLRPSEVRRLVVESGDRRVELIRSNGAWRPRSGTPPGSASLLFASEDRLLRMQAYRAVTADPSDPSFGLAPPEIVVTAEDTAGTRYRVLLGAPSFSGGGFYARRPDESRRLYLIPRQTMDDLRSLVAGQPVKGANPVQDKLDALVEAEEQPKEQPRIRPYLQQVLDAGAQLPAGLE